jgi:hypothetical protein
LQLLLFPFFLMFALLLLPSRVVLLFLLLVVAPILLVSLLLLWFQAVPGCGTGSGRSGGGHDGGGGDGGGAARPFTYCNLFIYNDMDKYRFTLTYHG